MKKIIFIWLGLLALGLSACNSDNELAPAPTQHWKDMDVRIESHPNPPVAGMSEMVVIITGPHGRPIYEYLVSLRGGDAMPWVQAIQDGNMGVYRRAIDLGDGPTAVLQVRLQRGEAQQILSFPLKLAAN